MSSSRIQKQSLANLRASYEALVPSLLQFSRRLESLTRDLLELKKIQYHAIEVRTKTVESFLEKLARPGKAYSDPLRQITDLVGLRIILYYPSDVDEVSAIWRDQFSVDESSSVDKRAELASDQFGYSSVHLVCRLSEGRRTLAEWSPFESTCCEVQVRTVLQHAWASISHALQYKHESDVPAQFKRRLNRLAGLLELADAEFLSLKQERTIAAVQVEEQILKHNFEVGLDSISLTQYLPKSKVVKQLCGLARKAGFGITAIEDVNQLPQICLHLQIKTIQQLDEELRRSLPLAQKFFPAFAIEDGTEKKDISTSGDSDHWSAALIVAQHSETMTLEVLEKLGLWSVDYRVDVLKAAKSAKHQLAKDA